MIDLFHANDLTVSFHPHENDALGIPLIDIDVRSRHPNDHAAGLNEHHIFILTHHAAGHHRAGLGRDVVVLQALSAPILRLTGAIF